MAGAPGRAAVIRQAHPSPDGGLRQSIKRPKVTFAPAHVDRHAHVGRQSRRDGLPRP